MKLLTTTLLISIMLNYGFSQSNSFRYAFELDTLIDESQKSFLSDLTEGINISSRYIKGQYSFEIKSPDNFTEEEFSDMIALLGSNLVTFNKTIITEEYLGIEKNGGQDCPNSAMVCSNSSLSGNASGYGTQELTSSNDGCLGGENQSSWYYINVGTGGTLAMEIAPQNGTDDYDFAIWGPFTESNANQNCPPNTSPIRCNYAQYPRTGNWLFGYCGTNTNPTGMALNAGLPTSVGACPNNPYSRHLDVNPGEIYILVIDNYSGSTQPFDLTWEGTAGLDCTTVPLPVELLDFTVSNQKVRNFIEWSTASEKNNDYFILEYSNDGVNWNSIEQVDGAGTTNNQQTYMTTHRDYENGINYYRLNQVDYDGTETKHKIISIDNSEEKTLLKRVNTMGQEVNEHYEGMVILYYNNGSTKKTFQQ